MTALTWQTLLLLSLAYLVGCWLACLVRRMIGPGQEAIYPDTVPAVAAAAAAPVARQAAPAAVPAAAQPAPARSLPVAPVRDAFRRADTLEPAPAAPASATPARAEPAAMQPSPTPVAPAPVAPTRPAPPVAPPAPPPAAEDTVKRLERALTEGGAATAAASTAAAVAAAAAARPAQVAPPPAPVPAGESAPVADDLKRIRTVDPGIEAALRRLGVRRFADIANWTPADVQRFSQELGFKGRIEQENWIEQAQILAKGGETFYSGRIARGEVAGARPVEDEGEPAKPHVSPAIVAAAPAAPAPVAPPAAPPARPVVAVAPAPAPTAPAAPRPERSSVEAAAAAAAAMAAAAATARSAAMPASPALAAAPAPAPVPPATREPEVADRAAFGRAEPAAGPASPAPVAEPPAAPRAAVGNGRDSLQRIGGVTAEIEKLLNVQGVSRYGQIAQWSASDTERFDRLLGYRGRIQRENWIEQAQILARGGDTAYSREHDRRTAVATGAAPAPVPTPIARVQAPSIPAPERTSHVAAPAAGPAVPGAAAAAASAAAAAAAAAVAAAAASQAPAVARPTNLADAIRSSEARAPEPAARSSDLSSLRSVRSEAFRPGSAPGSSGARPAEQHDLKRIRGIGVLIEKKLNSMGITRYEQIADWTAPDIERVSTALDFKGRIERENWVEQARILASGGQTEFSRRVDKGDGSAG